MLTFVRFAAGRRTEASLHAHLAATLDLSKRVLQSCPASTIRIPISTAIYTKIRRLLETLIDCKDGTAVSFASDRLCGLLFGPFPDALVNTSTPERVRLLRAEALLAFANALRLADPALGPETVEHFSVLEARESSVQVRQLLSRGRQLLQHPGPAAATSAHS